MPTRKQIFATATFARVDTHRNESPEWKKAYVGTAQRIPVIIRESGLLQAVMYIQARGDAADKECMKDIVAVVMPNQTLDQFSAVLRTCGVREYMYWTQLTLDAIIWFKRIAKVELDPS
jgi:CRISPR-associated protein Cmr5